MPSRILLCRYIAYSKFISDSAYWSLYYLAQMLKKVFDFFLFSSLYISCCAVIMVWQTNQLLHLQYDKLSFIGFVFASTMCSYNFHWYLTPDATSETDRAAWTRQHKIFQMIFF